jgi:hypothetical protein
MEKVIVYQGYEEKFRWRLIDEDGKFIEHSDLLDTEEEAMVRAKLKFPDLEIENRVVHEEEQE